MHSSDSNVMYLKNQFLGLRMKSDENVNDFITHIDETAKKLIVLREDVKDLDKSLILIYSIPN